MNSSDNSKREFNLRWIKDAQESPADIEWIVDGIFSEGSLAILFGPPGSGKTYAALDLAVCVSGGIPWLDFSTKKVVSLFVDEESGEGRLARRINETIRGHNLTADNLPLAFISLNALNIRDSKEVLAFRDLVRETGAQLIVIDALADVLPDADENSTKDVLKPLRRLRAIAEELRASIVIIHHSNKAGGYRGSSSIAGAVDVLLSVKSSGSRMEFKTEKTRDVEPFAFAAKAIFDTDSPFGDSFYLSPAEKRTTAALSKSQQFVIDYLKDHGTCKGVDIQNSAEIEDVCSFNTARMIINELKKNGMIERADSGGRGSPAFWRLVESQAGETGKQNGRVKNLLEVEADS